MSANPNDPHHAKLESDVTDWLSTHGFFVESNTYHRKDKNGNPVLDKRFIARLQSMKDINALIVRTSADRIAVHRAQDYSFFFECKTNSDPTYRNFTIEALPMAMHREKAHLGARCLYVLRDVIQEIAPGRSDCCFWANELPEIESLWMLERHKGTEIENRLKSVFDGIRIVYRDRLNGSGDPFVRILRDEVRRMFPCWKTAATAFTIPQGAI